MGSLSFRRFWRATSSTDSSDRAQAQENFTATFRVVPGAHRRSLCCLKPRRGFHFRLQIQSEPKPTRKAAGFVCLFLFLSPQLVKYLILLSDVIMFPCWESITLGGLFLSIFQGTYANGGSQEQPSTFCCADVHGTHEAIISRGISF